MCLCVVLQGDGGRSVYAVSGLSWGAYTDAEMRKKRLLTSVEFEQSLVARRWTERLHNGILC